MGLEAATQPTTYRDASKIRSILGVDHEYKQVCCSVLWNHNGFQRRYVGRYSSFQDCLE